jgi:predicted HTH transcriptional regulator
MSGVSYAQNPHLRQLARKRGLVEKRGLGFQMLMTSCRENNNPEPLIEELPMAVLVTLYRSQRKNLSHHLPTRLLPLLPLYERNQSFQTSEASALLKVSSNTARKWLFEAESEGLVKSKSQGRSAKWDWVKS